MLEKYGPLVFYPGVPGTPGTAETRECPVPLRGCYNECPEEIEGCDECPRFGGIPGPAPPPPNSGSGNPGPDPENPNCVTTVCGPVLSSCVEFNAEGKCVKAVTSVPTCTVCT